MSFSHTVTRHGHLSRSHVCTAGLAVTVTGTTWPQPACPARPPVGEAAGSGVAGPSRLRLRVRLPGRRARSPWTGARAAPPAPGPSAAARLLTCRGICVPCLLGYDARTTRRTGLKAQFHELRHRHPPTYSPLSKTQSTSMTQKVLSPGFPPIPRAHAKRYCHHVPASGFREVPRHVAAGVRLPVPNTAFSRCPVTRIRGTCQEWPRHSYWRAACHRAHPGLATPTPVHSDHRTCPLT